MEDVIDLIDKDRLNIMAESQMAREAFGPGTDHPYLAIALHKLEHVHAAWLSSLPCPVIGVGEGALAGACDVLLNDISELDLVSANIKNAPMTSMVLVQLLRASEMLDVRNALIAESFAYATVQKGPEFFRWLKEKSDNPERRSTTDQPLKIFIKNGQMELILDDPENMNAIGISMRDALCEALDLAIADPSLSKVRLTGSGRCFSTGGEVGEFGDVADPATAHWIRSLRLPAGRLAQLRDRLRVHVNGAAIGAGAEIAAFGKHVSASPKAWFQLPELKYGLIPGAGGTVSLPRRIGRQRTAYLALSMKKINAQTALDWGLIDEVLS